MLLKGRLPACGGQARQAISGSPARPTAAHRRRHAAFKGGRQASSVQVSATAEPAAAAAGTAPARGPRAPAREVSVRLEEVEAGDEFTGTVTAVEAYGAFVNFGAEKDGLCHISQLKDGYVSSAADAVSVGEEVQVRVLSVDAASGKIALTMKGMQEGEEGGMDAVDDDEEDDEGAVASLVYGDDRTDFSFPFQVEADEGELTPEALAEAAKSELEVEHETDLELPLNELVHGKVTKVDGVYGAYITVTYNGREIEAYLDRDEAKVPSSALSAEDLLEFVGEGEPVPEYIDIVGQEILYEDDEDEDSREEVDDRFMFEDMSAYYKEGDEVTAFVLGFDSKRDMMALTHFTDAEVQGDALEALGDELAAEEDEEDEGEGGRQDRDGPPRRRKFVASAADDEDEGVEDVDEDEVPLARLEPAADFDPLSFSPEELMAMEGAEDGDGDDTDGAMGDDDLDGEAAVAIGEYKVFSRGLGLSTNSKRSIRASDVDFPTRPSGSVDPYAMQGVVAADTDFDGDEIYLDDIWQDGGLEVSAAAWKKLGLKIQFDESGEAEVVEREGGAAAAKAAAEGADAAEEGELAVVDDEESEESLMAAASADHDARVASWVSLLLEDDGDADEAEVPAFAMRRPVVLAVSVEPAAGAATAAISAGTVKALRDKTGAGMMDCKKALGECGGDTEKAIEWLRKKGLSGADKKAGRVAAEGAISQYIHPGSRLGVLLEVNCETDFVAASDKFRSLVGELGMIIAASPDVMVVTADEVPAEVLVKEREVEMGKEDIKSKPEAVRAKIVEGRLEKMRNSVALVNQASLRDPNKTVAEIVKETIAAIGENVQIRRFVKYRLGEGLEKRSNDFAAEVAQQTQKKEEPKKAAEPKKEPEAPKAAAAAPAAPAYVAPAALVKELRDKTGAGMMDCKKALAETAGDTEKAMEWLRKKGLSGADKKAGRVAAEGVIAAYIHPGSRLGVLLEVNCETDFVARSDPFNALVNGLAMQIAASPMVQYVSADEIPAEVFEREKQIEMGREDLKNKPEAIRAKIAEGRTQKLAQEMALLPQPYLMDNSKTVEQAVKEAIASIGEKISIRRFVRYQLGEGIEKKVMDLAADVAAMTKSA